MFREPKSTNQVDEILKSYAAAIASANSKITGSLLFSVIGNSIIRLLQFKLLSILLIQMFYLGGKLSEGLNFSDDLGRCVIVIGLPYPNIKSAELQEKMNYLNNHVVKT